ncbi:HNH endonuclease [Falsiroseomonas oryzae]|uniref:HNH endonuclease n=1 Tax=Falsiroseomonas oryzae TaxID=2766473 RepID=UPI0038CBF6E7
MCSKSVRRYRHQAARRQDFRCWYCAFPIWDEDPATFAERHSLSVRLAQRFRCTAEHLQARSTGGADTSDNIVAACAHCNSTRHRRKNPPSPEVFRTQVARRMERGRWHPAPAHSAFAVSREATPMKDAEIAATGAAAPQRETPAQG